MTISIARADKSPVPPEVVGIVNYETKKEYEEYRDNKTDELA